MPCCLFEICVLSLLWFKLDLRQSQRDLKSLFKSFSSHIERKTERIALKQQYVSLCVDEWPQKNVRNAFGFWWFVKMLLGVLNCPLSVVSAQCTHKKQTHSESVYPQCNVLDICPFSEIHSQINSKHCSFFLFNVISLCR